MWIDLLTLFPEMFSGVFGNSILKRAQDNGLLRIEATNIRDFARDKHRSVDDKPYGGGVGMVMMCQPFFDAVESLQQQKPEVDEIILLTPQGQKFDQQLAERLARKQRLILMAGHYEGFDERIRTNLATMEISIGDYVLTGGEIPAMIVVDTIARLVPGVLGSAESHLEESFGENGENGENLLEYPQYTRPSDFRGMEVPEVLLSGNHERIRKWRLDQARERTRQRRPDLLNETE